MIDRTQFRAQGLDGGEPGALGEFLQDEQQPLTPKTVIWFAPEAHVHLNPPGGGGYGAPFARQPEQVLEDVINGYVSLAAAEREYGVVVRYTGTAEQLVRLPHHYAIDWPATTQRRSGH